MDLLQGHTQLSIQTVVEVTHKVAGTAVGALPGSYLAILVGVLIQEEYVDIAAADLVLVQSLHHADEHSVLGAGQDHNQLLVLDIGHTDAVHQIHSKVVMYILHDLQFEFGVFKVVALLCIHIFLLDTQQNIPILVREPFTGGKFEVYFISHNFISL